MTDVQGVLFQQGDGRKAKLDELAGMNISFEFVLSLDLLTAITIR